MSAYEFTGTVVHIGDVQEFGDKGFYKRDLVISDDADKYPQEVCFECPKGASDDAGDLEKGDRVTVTFDLKGRYWAKGDRWFTSASAWKVEKVGSKPAPRKQDDPAQEDIELDSEDDEMPPF